MLHGHLPFRDFVDPGAPLTFALAALVQVVGGRGSLSEIVFCITALSFGAALTWAAATRASGSTSWGLFAAAFQAALLPRLYNYPKILVYACAIPVLWAYANRPSTARSVALACVTAVAFLLRHDHGAYVAVATAATILCLPERDWLFRVKALAVNAGLVLLLLAPYIVFLQANGGVLFHLETANSWSQRDRARAPLGYPAFSLTPEPPNDDEDSRSALTRLVARNSTPWTFYLLLVTPVAAALVLWRSRNALRPAWPLARAKLAGVVVLAALVNAGFLRGNLPVRFADVSVPNTILLAWLGASAFRFAAMHRRRGVPAAAVATVAGVMTLWCMSLVLYERPVRLGVQTTRTILERIHPTWPLARWSLPEDEGPMRLAHYLNACTAPGDRIFMSQYLPQVIALADRAFAGGHGDLRPDFFNTPRHQQLTIDRLASQRVPVAIVPPGDEFGGFRRSLPLVAEYLLQRFERAGARDLGEGVRVELLVERGRQPVSHYGVLDWPCFR